MTLTRHLGKAVRLIAVIVLVAVAVAPAAAAPISPQARQALIDATTSEFKALATYQAVVKKFGDERPFASWIRSGPERIDENLKPLFAKYGVAVPAMPDPTKVAAPASLKDACRIAVQLEGERLVMYEKSLKTIKEADVVEAFTRMRDAARRRQNGVREHCE